MAFVVERNNDTSRYELMIEGVLQGVVIFRSVSASAPEEPVVLHISHAEVVPELRGKGFSEPMVRAALDDVRARGERVVSTCWYVSAFLESHPDYADLIAR